MYRQRSDLTNLFKSDRKKCSIVYCMAQLSTVVRRRQASVIPDFHHNDLDADDPSDDEEVEADPSGDDEPGAGSKAAVVIYSNT